MNSQTGYKVCIQILEEPYAKDIEATIHFMQQLDIGRHIVHRNISRIHESKTIEGIPVLEYEYFRGVSFLDFVEKKHILPKVRISSIWVKIARTLQHASFIGIPHGCPSPDHILIDPDTDQIKIFGFGIHYLYDFLYPIYPDRFTEILPFIAPEAIQVRTLSLEKSDVYAFGVLCYYMLTRKLPFYADSVQSIIDQKQQAPPSPKDINTHVPVILADWAMSLLHPVPEERNTLNTFLDYLDPQPDNNVYPDLRKRDILPKGFMQTVNQYFSRFFTFLPGITTQNKRILFAAFGVLIVLFAVSVVINNSDNDKSDEITAAYEDIVRSANSKAAEAPDRIEEPFVPEIPVDTVTTDPQAVPDAADYFDNNSGIQQAESIKLSISAFSQNSPVNSQVYINGNFIGRSSPDSPLQVSVKQNTPVVLSVRSSGYKEWKRQINAADHMQIQAELEALNRQRSIYIAETDFADRVRVDQGDYQQLPLHMDLRTGEHRFFFLHSQTGFTFEQSFQLTQNSPDTLKYDRSVLGQGSALFVLRNAEEHGYVFVKIDDNQARQTTPYKTTLSAGPHKVMFSRTGYTVLPEDTVFVVKPDQQVKITCRILE